MSLTSTSLYFLGLADMNNFYNKIYPTTIGKYSCNRATVVRDLLSSQKDTITCIVDDITTKTLNILKEEIGY